MILSYRYMTPAERTASVMALTELVGERWRDVPVEVEIESWGAETNAGTREFLDVPVMQKPVRLNVHGKPRLDLVSVPVTDANRWAAIFLETVADRQDGAR